MDEQKLVEMLAELLGELSYYDQESIEDMGLDHIIRDNLEDVEIQTYEEASLLTMDKGLVIRFKGGAKFQLRILRV